MLSHPNRQPFNENHVFKVVVDSIETNIRLQTKLLLQNPLTHRWGIFMFKVESC